MSGHTNNNENDQMLEGDMTTGGSSSPYATPNAYHQGLLSFDFLDQNYRVEVNIFRTVNLIG